MTSKNLNYIPGLDGIRALSAFLVISSHWPNSLLSLPFGWIGVNIFFVLSGFLIARILINNRQQSFKKYISSFYFKRALRIFPLYYGFLTLSLLLVLFITYSAPFLLSLNEWKDIYWGTIHDFPYCFTYTYNLRANLSPLIHVPTSSDKLDGHLWSLCLEEQFYLIFPFLVYFLSLKNLKITTISILISCPLLRLWGVLYGEPHFTDHYWLGETFYTNIFCQADALFMGVGLAIFDVKIIKPYLTFVIVLLLWLLTGVTCLVFIRQAGWNSLAAIKSLGYDPPSNWFLESTKYWLINIRPFYQYTIVNLLAVSLILPAIKGRPLFLLIFQNKGIAYLGKISYGIYVFHYPILSILIFIGNTKLGGWYNLTNRPFPEICAYMIYIAITLIVAHLSYQYFEKRFLKYKTVPIKKLSPIVQY
ncbi:acyltransferase [Mucilaginibacter sp. BT774]|uniref:acyltransferase family protein n=1 Tax=Mucilaginibacter sp. BT774 TaxID=3062276 RepID=UPI00267669B4|nr:acyltransferase [Mucilaginibacter sp. BT774]MDO3627500.1 acyltransferase [Mucilaginibacter sp. BT774]